MLKRNGFKKDQSIRVLDLGCGKGAVSLAIAKRFGYNVLGIDAVPQFIVDAQWAAIDEKVSAICCFEVGDIRKAITRFNEYDLLILGAVGYVFGSLKKTLEMLRRCIKEDGHILMDDAYIDKGSDFESSTYLKREQYIGIIEKCRMKIVDELVFEKEKVLKTNKSIFCNIAKRTKELGKKYPEKKKLFDDYIKKQAFENEVLEENVKCFIIILRKDRAHAT